VIRKLVPLPSVAREHDVLGRRAHEPAARRASASTISAKRGQVVVGATVEPYAVAVLVRDAPEAIVLYLVNPQRAGRQYVALGGKARRDHCSPKDEREASEWLRRTEFALERIRRGRRYLGRDGLG
jgi:hypothetical protein